MILKGINDELQALNTERNMLEGRLQDQGVKRFENVESFKKFANNLIEHLPNMLSEAQNLEEKKLIFQFVFV